MTIAVLDASALLAFLQNEPGADAVEPHLDSGAVCGAANWTEVVQKVTRTVQSMAISVDLLYDYDFAIEPVTVEDAERAAALWASSPALSLADRLCIALGDRLDVSVLTADSAWGSKGRIEQIR